MTIKTILRMGNPELYKRAIEIKDFQSPELAMLLTDLWDTMLKNKGVGIAATQIGALQQVCVFGFDNSERYTHAKPVPNTVLINPKLEPLNNELNDDWEGCLSIPGIRGLVTRHTHIRYSGYDQNGKFFAREVSGFHARVVQHEYDHLCGKLFPWRVRDLRYLGFQEELLDCMQTMGSKLP